MNKPVYLGLSILDLSKTKMYEFRYDYVKPNYGENGKLCYMYTGSFIVQIKADDIYKDIAEDIEKRFDTSSFEIDRPLQIGKNKKSDCVNETWIRWTNDKFFFWIKSKYI